ncbi:head maturation protease, ClpP-related [Streptomyces sp. 4.24]|uniref:head maturation protease, ClpP-related n=1 Tax=Streptomyces tritrimontium TaxID=3406573 RepID=UPI003BB6D126
MDLKASLAERRDWYRITNNAGSPAVVDIFDEIGFWGVNAAAFQRELAQVSASEITVNLSSPGGEIFEGIAIYNALRTHPANVTIRVSALAASIASVIAQAGDRIVMLSGSQMMIHEGSGLCMGNAEDMQQMAALLDRQSANIADIYAERAGGSADEWRARMRAETWFNAEEAVASGLADEVEAMPRKGEPVEESVAARWDLSVFNYAGRAAAPAPVMTAVDPVGEPAAVPEPAVEAPLTNEAPAVEEPAPEPEPEAWAAHLDRLFTPAPDSWAAHVAHLFDNTTSSSAATAHA